MVSPKFRPQNSIDAIIKIVVKLYLDYSSYLDCGICVGSRLSSHCLSCIAGLIADDVVDELPCIFVNECENCIGGDEACCYPIEVEVIDWEKIGEDDIPCCYG